MDKIEFLEKTRNIIQKKHGRCNLEQIMDDLYDNMPNAKEGFKRFIIKDEYKKRKMTLPELTQSDIIKDLEIEFDLTYSTIFKIVMNKPYK